MKAKLLKRLRKYGRNEVTIYSTTSGTTTGMSYGYNDDAYRNVYSFGDTKQDVKEKAARIYIKLHFDYIRKRYKKYSRNYKLKTKTK